MTAKILNFLLLMGLSYAAGYAKSVAPRLTIKKIKPFQGETISTRKLRDKKEYSSPWEK